MLVGAGGGGGARSINQMKLSHAHMLISINALLTALNSDGEDGMRTGAVFIHICGANRPLSQKQDNSDINRFTTSFCYVTSYSLMSKSSL